MTLRLKTIEYAFPASETSVAAAGARAFTTLTIYIPETTGRVFRSCFLIVYVQDNVTVATSPASWRIQARLGAVALDTTGDGATVTDTITNSGEQCCWIFSRNVTSLFTSDFGAGTSQTFDVTLTIATSTTINASCKVIITYEYNDSATTRIKTVKIPIESVTGAQTITLTEIGTNQIPALDTFLPEASKVYRDIFFEITCNDGENGTVDFNLNLALDAEAADATGLIEAGLTSARLLYYLWKRTDMTTNATHQFKASVTSIAGGTFDCLGAVLVVTYEYNETTTTTVMNSIQSSALDEIGFIGGTTSADNSRFKREFFIEEPNTITLVQSGMQFFVIDSGAMAIAMRAGSQAFRTYNIPARMVCGGFGFIHRIDSGGAQGAGITLARGKNTFVVDVYRTSSTFGSLGTAQSAILYLNYTSGKSALSGGTANHNHTVAQFSQRTLADANLREFTAFAPIIPETNYWLTGIGYWIASFAGGTAQGYNALVLKAEYLAGEGPENGWEELYAALYNSDAELAPHIQIARARQYFKRHPNDPDTDRMDIETARKYRLECRTSSYFNLFMFFTYHTITFTISGTVSGYTGDGSGITVEIHRTDTDEKMTSAVTSAGGGFSAVLYDNTINCYAHARQDATHVGRSDDGVAS